MKWCGAEPFPMKNVIKPEICRAMAYLDKDLMKNQTRILSKTERKSGESNEYKKLQQHRQIKQLTCFHPDSESLNQL